MTDSILNNPDFHALLDMIAATYTPEEIAEYEQLKAIAQPIARPVRIYQVNEYEWYAATSREQAIGCLVECVGEEEAQNQMEDGYYPIELSDQQMREVVFCDSDGVLGEKGQQCSFADALQRYLAAGWVVPFAFALRE